jgi:RNA polymerase sigma-70 factor (ECF subfamily)
MHKSMRAGQGRLRIEEESDEALVAAAQADLDGSAGRAAAGRLLQRYQKAVYLWCYRHVDDHERALDLAQETLLQAYRDLPSFEARSRFSSWLFVIARNRCLSELRRRPLLEFEGDAEGLPAVPVGNESEEKLLLRLDRERLLRLVRRVLDREEQDAVWLRYGEKMPLHLITLTLGIVQESGARAILQRARRKLRAALRSPDVAGSLR